MFQRDLLILRILRQLFKKKYPKVIGQRSWYTSVQLELFYCYE